MATLAIMNYESAEIVVIDLSSDIAEKYAADYDQLVFNEMGYKPSEVYYMVAENIEIIRREKI